MARMLEANRSSEAVLPPALWRRALRRRLRAWYGRAARDLAWRRTRDPYRIWLSEIMLQQTQVRTVERYFERFVAALPTIESLAAADEQRVLRLWEGLGYYRRARQLHAAAKIIVRDHGGRFPRDVEAVRRLPGIGRYTAGAILSIAFDLREPILEANTARLFARLLAYRGDTQRGAGQKLLWRLAAALLPESEPGIFNQALMELGSLVCLPNGPRCGECPVATLCPTAAGGLQEVIPRPKAKPRVERLREAAVVIRRGGRMLLLRCREGQRWAGLWDFPRFSIEARGEAALRRELSAKVRELTGVEIDSAEHLTTMRHTVTRFRITLECFSACFAGRSRCHAGEVKWVRPAELDNLPLSTTGRKLARLVAAR